MSMASSNIPDRPATLDPLGTSFGWRGLIETVLVVCVCTLMSVAVSGQLAGWNNNIFHLPIMEKLYDEPQFKNDAFIQSLRFYASGFWILFAGVADDNTALWFFTPLQIISRVFFFASVVATAPSLGLTDRHQRIGLLLIVCLATTLRGLSPAGAGGLFIEGFTHSEFANATVLISIALASRQQFGWALMVNGITFFLNAFMSVWTMVPLSVLMLLAFVEGELPGRLLIRQIGAGGLAFVCLAAPVLVNIVRNPGFGHPLGFDYRTFLMEYWPEHFLVRSLRIVQITRLAISLLAGLIAARLQAKPQARFLIVVIGSFTAVWLAGCIAPFVTASPTILNLHLLRSSAVIEIFVTLSLAAYIVQLASSKDDRDRFFWSPLFLVLLLVDRRLLLLLLIALVIKPYVNVPVWITTRVTLAVALVVLACATADASLKAFRVHKEFGIAQQHWIDLSTWARHNTAKNAIFLLPVENIRPAGPLPPPYPDQVALLQGNEVFWTFAHRQIWVGDKAGAAVMWEPSYYAEWRPRIIDVLKLSSLKERLAYAHSNGISIVVDECGQSESIMPVFKAGNLCAFPVTEEMT